MALIPAKCTQCGANIQVNSDYKAGTCPHCGTNFITENAINNYNVNYNVTKIINNTKEKADDLIADGLALWRLGEVTRALDIFRKVTQIEPRDLRGWFYVAKILCDCKILTSQDEMFKAINNAYGLAKTDIEKQSIKETYKEIKHIEIATWENKLCEEQTKINDITAEYKKIEKRVEANNASGCAFVLGVFSLMGGIGLAFVNMGLVLNILICGGLALFGILAIAVGVTFIIEHKKNVAKLRKQDGIIELNEAYDIKEVMELKPWEEIVKINTHTKNGAKIIHPTVDKKIDITMMRAEMELAKTNIQDYKSRIDEIQQSIGVL